MVNAVKGNQKQSFPENIWNEMPAHKYGWKPQTDMPEEVKAALVEQGDKEGTASEATTTTEDKPEEKPDTSKRSKK